MRWHIILFYFFIFMYTCDDPPNVILSTGCIDSEACNYDTFYYYTQDNGLLSDGTGWHDDVDYNGSNLDGQTSLIYMGPYNANDQNNEFSLLRYL